jgi:hypothetical protein
MDPIRAGIPRQRDQWEGRDKVTLEDLKELGISASGTARMLLDAIAQLCADANTEIAAAPHTSP